MSDCKNTVRPGTSRTKFITLTGLMTAAICIVGPFSLPLPVSPVPVTLTNFTIYIAVYVLGLKAGTVSCLIYLCLGAAGLPVFSSFNGGIGKLAGPTGGYLIGFLFLALIQGILMLCFSGKNAAAVTGMILGTAVCYLFGTVWLAGQMHLTFQAALAAGVIPYLPGDAAKIVLASLAGPKLNAAVRKL